MILNQFYPVYIFVDSVPLRLYLIFSSHYSMDLYYGFFSRLLLLVLVYVFSSSFLNVYCSNFLASLVTTVYIFEFLL